MLQAAKILDLQIYVMCVIANRISAVVDLDEKREKPAMMSPYTRHISTEDDVEQASYPSVTKVI